MKKFIIFVFLAFCSSAFAQGSFTVRTPDSIGIDTDGDGTVDGYIYPAFLKKGSNITFTIDTDTLTIAGPSASGTADSLGVDTDGDGTVDAYLYSTTAGAFHLKKGSNITLTVDNDTVTIAATGGGGLTYFTEADDNDTSVFTATGPNTTVGLNDRLTMQGNDITGVGNLTVATGITVPDNSISDEELNEGGTFSWTGGHTFGGAVWFDDGSGDSPNLVIMDEDNKSLLIKKYDAGFAALYNDEASVRFMFSGDQDDYIYMDTFSPNVPMIATGGACDLFIVPSGGDLIIKGNTATGDTTTGDVDVFYYFGKDGSWTTEYLKWDDGASRFNLSSYLGVTGDIETYSGDVLSQQNIYINSDGADANSYLYYYENSSATGAYIYWDEANGGFAFSHSLLFYFDTAAVVDTAQALDAAYLPLGGGQMTGNITMSGAETVDGKDVSTLTDIGQNVETGEITDQTIAGDDIDSTAENFVFDGAYHITSAFADSQFMSKKYIDDAAGGLTDQSVKGNHVDSTAEDFVFVNPYKGTSAVADSVLTTRKELGDSSTAIRGDFPGGLGEQLVKGDHVDSTAENFVFDDPYKGTSAVGDSVLTTRKELGDSATAVRADFPAALTEQGVKGDHVDSTAENFVFVAAYEGTSAEADSQYSTHNWVQVEIEDSLNEYSLTSGVRVIAHDTGDVLRAEMDDSVAAHLGDTANVVRSEVRDTSALVAHDTADVLRAEMDDSAAVHAHDTADVVRSKIRDTVNAVLDTIWFGMTIDNPDGLTKDSVMVLAVDAEWAPNGITLLSVGIKTWAATSYSVDFIEFTEPGDGGAESAIETVATSTSREAEDDGTLTDADIAAGSIIVVDLPTTDIDQVQVWGTYVID